MRGAGGRPVSGDRRPGQDDASVVVGGIWDMARKEWSEDGADPDPTDTGEKPEPLAP